MRANKALGLLAIFLSLMLFSDPHLCLGEEKRATTEIILLSDELYYDPGTGKVTAKGNVEVTREDLIVKAPFAEGFINTEEFRFWDQVVASWPSQEATLTCLELQISKTQGGTLLRSVGNSHLVRGKEDDIRSNELEWLQGEKIYYSATGDVDAQFGQMTIVAEKVVREGENFKADKVRRFVDRGRGLRVSALEVTGKIKDEMIEELLASGSVVIDHEPKEGEKTHITGQRARYIKSKGVLEVTGDARAVQEGRTIEAENIIYHVDDKHIEALGRPKVTVEVKEE
ncbi:Lipopolysaccharide export system protein LptA [Acetomicrobium thermoterrenum DSM 13490]|uniref:Lipopolysaccharide export system protein LptA n=1 Tax=Acetomicrobium thermoterrenum DSM 13490 TaxID=1120987 RepID=A0A1H3DB36_9BACT|nr:LptA/OstA family protein [Acetomicrobium thermoterrenum]SDX63615.1 Lipopolysaccharide export system protein LptA [Acetomicrobium thermoterrenum DSM 13490]